MGASYNHEWRSEANESLEETLAYLKKDGVING